MMRQQNNFGAKNGNEVNITECRMDKQHQKRVTGKSTEGENTHRFTHCNIKKYLIGKLPAMTAYMETGIKNSLPSTTDYRNK